MTISDGSAKMCAKGLASLLLSASLMLGPAIPAFANASVQNQVVAGGDTQTASLSAEDVSPDKSALSQAISDAQAACKDVEESDTGVGLIQGTEYATSESYDALRSAMDAAQLVLDSDDATELEVSEATESLNEATSAFIEAKLVATGQKAEIEVPSCSADLTYNGLEQEAVVAGDGYILENASATDAGSYVAIATLVDTDTSQWSDGTTEPKEIPYTIHVAPIAEGSLSLKWNSCTYNGKARKPGIDAVTVTLGDKAVTLAEGVDYSVSYENNVNAGAAAVTITGKGNFSGSLSSEFTIKKASIAKGSFALKWTSCTYNGQARKPGIQTVTFPLGDKAVNLVSGTDYTVSYKNNVKAGTATVTITGKGNYSGSLSKSFTIKKASFSGAKCSVAAQLYTGKALKPNPVVKWNGTTLKKDIDYTLAYKNNVKVGKATVVITAKGNFSGRQALTFNIYQRKISSVKVSSIGTMSYTGGDIRPNPKVTYGSKTLKKGTDYTLSYKNNRYGGTASIIITGRGSYKGTKTVSFRISGPRYYGYTVYITDTGTKYHRSGCRYLKSRHAVDLGVARYEGYEPCKVCHP